MLWPARGFYFVLYCERPATPGVVQNLCLKNKLCALGVYPERSRMGALWQNRNETAKDEIDRAKMRIYIWFGGKCKKSNGGSLSIPHLVINLKVFSKKAIYVFLNLNISFAIT